METGYLDISIDQLLVYEDNPRFIKAVSQIDEINKIVFDDAKKKELVTLAESILLYGQNPLEAIGVILDKETKKFITVEGNRRLAAIKIYRNPLLAEGNKSTLNSFKSLISKYSNAKLNMPDTVRCYVFASLEQANYWITLKHTGKNNGAGIVPWSRVQSQRQAMSSVTAAPDKSMMLVEWLTKTNHLEDVNINTYEDIANTTTLNRLLDDKYVLEKFCLSYNNEFSSSNEKFSVQCICMVINELNSKKLPVQKVYDADARKSYVNHIYTELDLIIRETNNSLNDSLGRKNDNSEKNSKIENKSGFDGIADGKNDFINGNRTPSAPNYITRKKIVTTQIGGIKGIQGKASQVYGEIKLIDCSKQPIAAALLVRAFFEMTTKEFLKIMNKAINKTSNLGTLIYDCREHIIGNGTDYQKENAQKISIEEKGSKYKIKEIENLHKVIHDTVVVKDKSFFFSVWDTFRPFMQDLWDIYNEEKRKNSD